MVCKLLYSLKGPFLLYLFQVIYFLVAEFLFSSFPVSISLSIFTIFFTCYRHILYYFIESSVLKYLSAIIGNTWESISVDLLCSIHSYTRTFVSYQREILCSGAQVHFTTQTIAWMTFSDNVFTRILDQIRLLVLEPTSLHHSHIGGYAN